MNRRQFFLSVVGAAVTPTAVWVKVFEPSAAFKNGHEKLGGRKPGTPNKGT